MWVPLFYHLVFRTNVCYNATIVPKVENSEMKDMGMTFGTFIRQQRQSKGYSLRQLAAEAGLSPVYMSNIENDRRPAPVQDLMDKLERS